MTWFFLKLGTPGSNEHGHRLGANPAWLAFLSAVMDLILLDSLDSWRTKESNLTFRGIKLPAELINLIVFDLKIY